MGTVSANALLQHAMANQYAVGYFESWDLESTAAVIHAAEKMKSPVFIGFCGEYLNSPQRAYQENLHLYGKIVREMAKAASVPVATILNESIDINYAYKGVAAGFDMVMFVDEQMSVPELIVIQKKLVAFAHACGVAVEAELGALPTASKSGTQSQGAHTDIEIVEQFVREAGVDALAVAVGNIHLLEGQKANIDFDLLEKIHKKVTIPLVLHGGTGIDKPDFKEAASMGTAKVNVGAGLKRICINTFKEYLAVNDTDIMNPNHIFGTGGKFDLNRRSHDAIAEAVADFIRAFGSENKSEAI